MPIKNMPNFDDIVIEDEPKENTQNSLDEQYYNNSFDMLQDINNLGIDLSFLNEKISKLNRPLSTVDMMSEIDSMINSLSDDEKDALDQLFLKINFNNPNFLNNNKTNDLKNYDDDDEFDDIFIDSDEEEIKNYKPTKLFNEKFDKLSNKKDKKYSIPCVSFSLSTLNLAFPGLVEDLNYKNKISLDYFKNILDKRILDIYDDCVLLDEHVVNNTKTYTFATAIKSNYLPIYFTIYNSGDLEFPFKAYIHQENNPIDENGNILSIEDLLTEDSLNILKNSDQDDIFSQVYDIAAEMANKTNPVYNVKDVFIDITELPETTISDIGNFVAEPIEYNQMERLFYIGYIELNDTYEAIYFLKDYGLKAENNKLKVYAAFKSSRNYNENQVAKIKKEFNPKEIELNDTFKKYIPIDAFGDDGVIISFYAL